jgi:hypothetical protein
MDVTNMKTVNGIITGIGENAEARARVYTHTHTHTHTF